MENKEQQESGEDLEQEGAQDPLDEVELPLEEEENETEDSIQDETSDDFAGSRILIVDDVGYIRLILRRNLESAGYEVVEAGTAAEALSCLTQGEFDVVILDYHLPDLDGLSLFGQIQEFAATKTPDTVPPCILCTASLDSGAARKAVQLGFVDICSKPIHAPRLLEAVSQALAKSKEQI